jgi:hypothetical protein
VNHKKSINHHQTYTKPCINHAPTCTSNKCHITHYIPQPTTINYMPQTIFQEMYLNHIPYQASIMYHIPCTIRYDKQVIPMVYFNQVLSLIIMSCTIHQSCIKMYLNMYHQRMHQPCTKPIPTNFTNTSESTIDQAMTHQDVPTSPYHTSHVCAKLSTIFPNI